MASDSAAKLEVTDDAETRRFELRRDGELVGFATYYRDGNVVVVPHVETLASHRGKGYGERLLDGLLEIIRSRNQTIVAACPFAAQHIRDNPQHQDLLFT